MLDGDALLTLQVDHLPGDVQQFIGLRNLVFIAMTSRELIGHALPLRSVRILGPRPSYAPAVDRFCGIGVTWEAEVTCVGFDAAWLDHPMPGADEQAHLIAVRQCHRDLNDSRARAGVAARVREVIGVLGHDASLAQVADDLGMSERSLRRRLQEDGTSFRRLLGLERMELAAFSKAFKRWSGMSPQVWRMLP